MDRLLNGQGPEVVPRHQTTAERTQEQLEQAFGNLIPKSSARKLSHTLMGGMDSGLPAEMGLADLVPYIGSGIGIEKAAQDVRESKRHFDEGDYGDAALSYLAASLGLIPLAAGMKGTVQNAGRVMKGVKDLATSDAAYRLANKYMAPPQANIMAYQGSPHLYAPTKKNPLGELDPTKIGSGEGAQAYGYGHYLAQNKNVGEGYRHSVSGQHNQDVMVNGKPVDEYYMDVYGQADKLPMNEAQQQYDKASLIEMLGFNRSPNDVLSYAEDMGYAPSVIDWFKNGVMPNVKSPGHLYTHDLSDEAVARMLDYDIPLKEQAHVMESIGKQPTEFLQSLGLTPDSTGGAFQAALQGRRTADEVRQASEELRTKFGIPGVKYLDQDSKAKQAMGEDGGTRNFVLFPGEEDASTIIRREKEGGAVHMAGGGNISLDDFLNSLKAE
jgi:hypothetical protein